MYKYKTIVDYKKDDDDDLYRTQICEVFNMENYNHEQIIGNIKQIYKKFYKNEQFIDLIDFAKTKFEEEDVIYAFMFLFSWDYFELLHLCLNYLNNNNIIACENLSCIKNYER